MRHTQLRVLDSLRRVKDFTTTHADVLGPISTSDASREVEEAIEAATSHQAMQGNADRTLVGLMSRQRVLAEQLIKSHIQPIARFARGKLRGVPDFGELTMSVTSLSPGRLLAAARTMAATAGKHREEFTRAGLSADTVERLTAAVDAFAGAMAQRAKSRGLRVMSTTAIENALARGRDAVLVLDAQITQQLASDDPVLASWRSVSRVELKGVKAREVPKEIAGAGVTEGAEAGETAEV